MTATIFVDADACPVREEAVRVASRHAMATVFVANSGRRPSNDPMVRHVVVGGSFDAADDWIVAHAGEGDVAVTADVPLAARLVANSVQVVSPAGKAFTPDSIGLAAATRDLNQNLREAGVISGYNRPFSARDRSAFLSALELACRRASRRGV